MELTKPRCPAGHPFRVHHSLDGRVGRPVCGWGAHTGQKHPLSTLHGLELWGGAKVTPKLTPVTSGVWGAYVTKGTSDARRTARLGVHCAPGDGGTLCPCLLAMAAVTPKPGERCPQSAVRQGHPQAPPTPAGGSLRGACLSASPARARTRRPGPDASMRMGRWATGPQLRPAHPPVSHGPVRPGRSHSLRTSVLRREAESIKSTTEDARMKGWSAGTGRAAVDSGGGRGISVRCARPLLATCERPSSRSRPRRLPKAAQEAMVQGRGLRTRRGSGSGPVPRERPRALPRARHTLPTHPTHMLVGPDVSEQGWAGLGRAAVGPSSAGLCP